MRALWKGSLSIGLINIPVRLYGIVEERGGINLDYLHKKDLTPVKYVRVCTVDGKEIPFTDIVKGYEYREGDYVVLEEEDFERVLPGKSKMISVSGFCDPAEIDPLYYDKPYFLVPEEGAEKAFALMREGLRASGKVGIATFVMRAKERLAVLKPDSHALILHQLRYATEIRDEDALPVIESDIEEEELAVAVALIEHLTGRFEPEVFEDTYTKELKRVIDEKVRGQHAERKVKEPVPTPPGELMKLMRASLRRDRDRRFKTITPKSPRPRKGTKVTA